jgi:hypothetical protein
VLKGVKAEVGEIGCLGMSIDAEDAALFVEFIKRIIGINMGNIGACPAGQQGAGRSLMLGTVPQFMLHWRQTLSPGIKMAYFTINPVRFGEYQRIMDYGIWITFIDKMTDSEIS